MRASVYKEMFPLAEDSATEYRLITADHVSAAEFGGETIVKVAPEALARLASEAMRDTQHLLRSSHLARLRAILDDDEASDNDKFVALEFLKNANIAAGGVLPMCQDTGTAIVFANKGQRVWTDGDDKAALSEGIHRAYAENFLRYSQLAALDMYDEVNTGDNLPAQIDINATKGDAYDFLFMAKGGGSANKTFLFQETRALLTPERLMAFLEEKIVAIGTAACPPYYLAIVIGGTSAEMTLKTVKLASARYLDGLPTKGNKYGQAFRDLELEKAVHEMTYSLGIGAQFGGKYFCHDVRVIRLPRHGASCPVGLGVSCAADRQILGKITAQGVYLEQLETDPARYLPEVPTHAVGGDAVAIDLNQPMDAIRKALSGARPRDPSLAHRSHDRRPRHCARQAERGARSGRGAAAVLQGPLRLLRRPGQDSHGIRDRLVRSDDGGTHGFLRDRVPGRRRQLRHARQGQPLAPGDGGLREVRRLLSLLGRWRGRGARPGLHSQGGMRRVPRAWDGGDLADRGGELPRLPRRRRQGKRFFLRVRPRSPARLSDSSWRRRPRSSGTAPKAPR